MINELRSENMIEMKYEAKINGEKGKRHAAAK